MDKNDKVLYMTPSAIYFIPGLHLLFTRCLQKLQMPIENQPEVNEIQSSTSAEL